MITDLSAAGSMPSTRLAWRYLNRNSFRSFLLRRRSAARSVWSTMADTASAVDSGTMSLEVTVCARLVRSAESRRCSSSAIPCFSRSVSIPAAAAMRRRRWTRPWSSLSSSSLLSSSRSQSCLVDDFWVFSSLISCMYSASKTHDHVHIATQCKS